MGGRTSHMQLRIPIILNETPMCNVKKNPLEAGLLQAAKILIYDEVPMQHQHAQETIDCTLRDVCECDKPFGGLTVVFGGDFQQILPVIVKGSRSDIVDACIQRSVIWRNLKVLHLRTNMRLGDDQEEREFAQWQLNVGHGMHTDEDANITIPEQFHCSSNTVDALVDEIYPGIKELPHPPDEYFSKWSILSARNNSVDSLNAKILQDFPGQEKTFHSADSIKQDSTEENILMYPVEYLNSIIASGLPLSKLKLKL